MSGTHIAGLVLFATAITIAAWMTRHDVIRASDYAVFVADRWTGAIYLCSVPRNECTKIPRQTVTKIDDDSSH